MVELVEILGGGCAKCDALTKSANEAIKKLEWTDVEITHITDLDEIAKRGVFSTPALAFNGEILVSGKYLPPNKLERLLVEHREK
jgi:small redox-active disulfide protein 2